MVVQLNLVALTLLTLWWWWSLEGALGDPQVVLVNKGCSQYNATNLSNFYQNLNTTLAELRAQVSNQRKHFATAQATSGSDPVYAMFQCRNYLSITDCAACFAAAAAQIRNCSAGANGARVIYDGCFLRYESNGFFDQTTLPGNSMICGNQTAVGATAFNATAQQVLMDLQIATPKINGFFAATKTQVAGGGAIYAIAQCAETVTESGCLDCLNVGYNNIHICLPNTDGSAYDAGCFMRYSETAFFADNQTIDITPYLKQGGSSKKGAIIGGVVGGVGLVVILLALFALLRRYKKPKKKVPRGDILGATELRGPVTYRYNDLKTATKNFSDENKLGEGGFGDVYKGTLKNGKVVAVKKLLLGQSGKMDEQFESEVKLISNVHHKNLVRLLGCCSKGQERILVYEFMANNSLDRFLFGENKGSLNWKQRYDIILGTAKGLAYLHEDFHVCIIHRDIKTSNILLDDDMQPRIADFGLARLLPEDQSHLSTRFAGTLGYTAPEYAIHGQLSEKADAYSFGVVVLEVISGQKSSELRADAEGEFLLQRAWKLYEQDMHLELVDKTLDADDYDAEEVKKIIEIALLCTQASAAARPTMSEVVVLLKSKNSVGHMKPSMPVFVESNFRTRPDTSTSTVANPLLNMGCSTYNVSNLNNFQANINATFSSLKDEVSNESKHFATASETKGDVLTYTMFQCRKYLSKIDCLNCFNTAFVQIRNCSAAASGARVIYDDCFLRYESGEFYSQTTEPGNGVACGNTSAKSAGFKASGQQVLMDLHTATPKTK
ncbi:Cysteine-rich receptor-like protein kinase 3, partial [Mucuna pruriens]